MKTKQKEKQVESNKTPSGKSFAISFVPISGQGRVCLVSDRIAWAFRTITDAKDDWKTIYEVGCKDAPGECWYEVAKDTFEELQVRLRRITRKL